LDIKPGIQVSEPIGSAAERYQEAAGPPDVGVKR
jgi:hypothetical protein